MFSPSAQILCCKIQIQTHPAQNDILESYGKVASGPGPLLHYIISSFSLAISHICRISRILFARMSVFVFTHCRARKHAASWLVTSYCLNTIIIVAITDDRDEKLRVSHKKDEGEKNETRTDKNFASFSCQAKWVLKSWPPLKVVLMVTVIFNKSCQASRQFVCWTHP